METCDEMLLLLGSDSGDRIANLNEAILHISSRIGRVESRSKIYETEAWGFNSDEKFLNQAIRVSSKLEPMATLHTIKMIETEMGREAHDVKRYSPRVIDIDLIYIGARSIDAPELKVPHPLRAQRRFVLVPLADIASSFLDPALGTSVEQLLASCPDNLCVTEYHESA